jgi:hypothetical protein
LRAIVRTNNAQCQRGDAGGALFGDIAESFAELHVIRASADQECGWRCSQVLSCQAE